MTTDINTDGISFNMKINGRAFEICVYNDVIEGASGAILTGDEYDDAFDKRQEYFVDIALAKYGKGEIEENDTILITQKDTTRFRVNEATRDVGEADGVDFIEDGATPTPEPDFVDE